MIYSPSSAYYLFVVKGVEVDQYRYNRRQDLEDAIKAEIDERKETHDTHLASYGFILTDRETRVLTLLIAITTVR